MTPFEISVEEFKARRDAGEAFQLIDVREPHEHAEANLGNDELIPMGEFLGRVGDLDIEKYIVVYCRSGARSARVVEYMRRNGFPDMQNLAGGILEWIQKFGSV